MSLLLRQCLVMQKSKQCSCALLTSADSSDCCKYCHKHKQWLNQDDYTYDRYKLEAIIEDDMRKDNK